MKNIFLIILSLAFSIDALCFDAKDSKKVAFIYSYPENSIGSGDLHPTIIEKFKEANISIVDTTFYINCEALDEVREIKSVNILLNWISKLNPDIIIIQGDRAAYSAMKSNHHIIKEVPTILLGIKFLNHSLFENRTTKTYIALERLQIFIKILNLFKNYLKSPE